MDLDANIRELALSLDADYFGVADLSSAHNAILAQGGERVARYPRAVTIGMRLQDSLVDLLPDDDKAAAILYKHNSYDVVNLALDQMALRVANTLQRAGFDAFPIPASKRTMSTSVASSPINSQRTLQGWAGLGRAACWSLLNTAPGSGGSLSLPMRCLTLPVLPWSSGVVNVLHAWISARSTPLPADRSTTMNPGRHGTMLQPVTGILRKSRDPRVLPSAACACISVRTKGNPEKSTVNKANIVLLIVGEKRIVRITFLLTSVS